MNILNGHTRRGASRRSRRGLTIIELLVVSVIVAIALNSMASAIINTTRLAPVHRENAIAIDAARSVIDELRSRDFFEVFARYNLDPTDDPATGPSPGPFFAVDGLQLVNGDPDGFVGQIEFPTILGELREDFADRDFGMPRDLNQDGALDVLDHSGDYAVLPFRVRLQWRSHTGHTRDFTLYSVAAEL